MASAADPSSRTRGRGLVVAHADGRTGIERVLLAEGIDSEFVGDPYAAMGELCQKSGGYRVIVLSLQGIYQEELTLIPAIKRRFPHVEVLLAHTDGRHGAMAEAMRLGADGLLSDQGLHRTATANPLPTNHFPPPPPPPAPPVMARQDHAAASEPLLTPEELRALLEDEPLVSGGEQ